MIWDLRERVLLAILEEQGHQFRHLSGGAACCLRCDTIVHVRNRARAMAGDTIWRGNPGFVSRCKPKTLTHTKGHT